MIRIDTPLTNDVLRALADEHGYQFALPAILPINPTGPRFDAIMLLDVDRGARPTSEDAGDGASIERAAYMVYEHCVLVEQPVEWTERTTWQQDAVMLREVSKRFL